MKKALILFSLLTAVSMLSGQLVGDTNLTLKKLDITRMPDLNIPRSGHNVFYANGELTVVGGHTSGFVMTPTAEYFSNGSWHVVPTVYSHDNGMVVVLDEGQRVLLAGGHDKNLGIGQSYEAEMYDVKTHTFDGFGSFDRNRAFAQGVEFDSEWVLIAGNHKDNDAFEVFDGQKSFQYVKDVAVWHSMPYLLPIAQNDAISFGAVWRDCFEPCDTVDRLKGEPFCVPLLKEWMPMLYDQNNHAHESFIGDKAAGDYSYLIAAQNLDGEVTFIHVHDTVFSLLPTTCPVPTMTEWGRIKYGRTAIADRQARRAYLVGNDTTGRVYVVAVEYDKRPAPLTFLYTDPQPDFGDVTPVLTPNGDLVIAGGIVDDNFAPLASVWLLHTGTQKAAAAVEAFPRKTWLWVFCVLLLVGIAVVIVRHYVQMPHCDSPTESAPRPDNATNELLNRITQLMETQHLYLNPELKLYDIADALGTNRNAVSACINAQGYTFNQFINDYRLKHAKQLLCQASDMKISTVALESGFASESSFFRAFKSATGMSPKEWAAQQSVS